MFVTLIPFFVITELQGVLGEGKFMQLFFRPRSSFTPASKQSSNAGMATPGSTTQSDRS
jgi:hypothetical protein